MKAQSWIFTVRYWEEGRSLDIDRWAVVGPGRASTVEAALHLASLPEEVRAQIRANSTVREFVDGLLDSRQDRLLRPRGGPQASPFVGGVYRSDPCGAR